MTLHKFKRRKQKARTRSQTVFLLFVLTQQFRTLFYSINFIYRNVTFNFIAGQRIANDISFYFFSLNISFYSHFSTAVNIARKIPTTGYITTCVTTSRKRTSDSDISAGIATTRQMTANYNLRTRIAVHEHRLPRVTRVPDSALGKKSARLLISAIHVQKSKPSRFSHPCGIILHRRQEDRFSFDISEAPFRP